VTITNDRVVSSVVAGSAAADAGLVNGMQIISVGGTITKNKDDCIAAVRDATNSILSPEEFDIVVLLPPSVDPEPQAKVSTNGANKTATVRHGSKTPAGGCQCCMVM